MPSEKRMTARQVSAEQTRHKLLAAALTEFSRRPYAEVTVAEIAREAGVAHGLLSHHFQGKQGIYQAAVDEIYQRLRESQEAEPWLPIPVQLRHQFREFLTYLAAHQDVALNMVLVAGRDEAFGSVRLRGLRSIAELVGLDPDNQAVRTALRSYADGVDGLTADWLRQGRPFEVDAVVEAFCALLAGAIRGARELDPALAVTAALSLVER